MARAQIALIIPLGDAPGNIPGYPDQGLPGGGEYPDQGLPGGRPPGIWPKPPRPVDPGYDRPEGGGGHPGNRPPGSGRPPRPDQGLPGGGEHPGNRPPGSWGGRPDQGLPDGGGEIDNTLPPSEAPPGGTPVPPEAIPTPPDPPEEYADQVIVQLYKPGQGWTTTAYEVGSEGNQ